MYEVPDEIPSGLQCATTARIAASGLLRGSLRAARGAACGALGGGCGFNGLRRDLRCDLRCCARLAARMLRCAACGVQRAACGARSSMRQARRWLRLEVVALRCDLRCRARRAGGGSHCGPQAAAPLPLPGPVAWGGPQHGPSACGVRPDHRPWPFRVQLIRLPPSPLHFHTPNL